MWPRSPAAYSRTGGSQTRGGGDKETGSKNPPVSLLVSSSPCLLVCLSWLPSRRRSSAEEANQSDRPGDTVVLRPVVDLHGDPFGMRLSGVGLDANVELPFPFFERFRQTLGGGPGARALFPGRSTRRLQNIGSQFLGSVPRAISRVLGHAPDTELRDQDDCHGENTQRGDDLQKSPSAASTVEAHLSLIRLHR